MSQYIHGTSPEEQQRLTLMNTILLNEGCLKELSLKGGEKVLDVGSGLGQFSRAMEKAIDNIFAVIAQAKDQMVQQKLFDEKKFDRVMTSLQDLRQKPDAALWYAVSWAEGTKSILKIPHSHRECGI